jgi:hypothetical protein
MMVFAGASPNQALAQVSPALASVSTDTGDFAPGRISLASYNAPQLCIGAVRNTARAARRDYASQIAAIDAARNPLHDTLPAKAVAMARACLTKFSPARIPPADLADLVRLALMANDDAVAAAAAERWRALAPSPAERDTVTSAIMEVYLTAQPARPAAADAFVAHAAQSGSAGSRWRIMAMARMFDFWSSVFDHAEIRKRAMHLASTLSSLPAPERRGLRALDVAAYQSLMQLAYIDSPDSMPAIVQQTTRDLARFERDSAAPMPWDPQPPTAEHVARTLDPLRWIHEALGNPYPVLGADEWFPGRPAPDDTSLALFISTQANWWSANMQYDGRECLQGDAELFSDAVAKCDRFYEEIRRLGSVYGSRGVRVILVAGTRGDAIRSLALTPRQEAERLRWFFLDYLKLPVTLAVVHRPFDSLPQPDGRRWTPPPCERSLASARGHGDTSVVACRYLAQPVVLLDKHGALLYAGNLSPVFDVIFSRALHERGVSSRVDHE